MTVDVATYVGSYPFRELPHPTPDVLVRVLDREQLSAAWVGHLPSAWHREPSAGNAALAALLAPYRDRLRPTPVVRPDWPQWRADLRAALDAGAPGVRAYPAHWGMGPHDPAMRELALAAGDLGLALILAVRFEDLRQRHPLDVAGDLTAAAIRVLARAGPAVRLLVLGAGREMIEEVHWSLTPEEQARVFWDFAWVWGPPEDHLAKLFRTIGSARFVYGTHWPLRLTQNSRANLDLLPADVVGDALADAREICTAAHE